MTVEPLDRLRVALPAGYRARTFEDADRDAFITERNRELHWMEQGDAEEWRNWERIANDPTRLRLSVEAPEGAVVAIADIASGFSPRPDGSQFVGVTVLAPHRNRGIGSALLDALEDEGRRRKVPRLFAGASESQPYALEFARKRDYREIGRRIASYVELAAFEPTRFADAARRARDAGVRLVSFADMLEGRDGAAQERFWRDLYEAEAPMWDDIPFATPTPHWPWDRFYQAATSGQMLMELSLVAYHGERIAGFTTTGRRGQRDAWTWMTGTAREHRGRGIAMALKVEALTRAKNKGLRAMGTTNDEPNKSMRGINAKLGYQTLPAQVELEKPLA
jgi:GNAT superfamily N-acetyltransferase